MKNIIEVFDVLEKIIFIRYGDLKKNMKDNLLFKLYNFEV